MTEIFDGGASLIVPDDLQATLVNCQAYYECPVDETKRPQGPLVGYAGKYDAGNGEAKHYVGLAYYNFSMADRFPAVRRHFARILHDRVQSTIGHPDLILGAPWAGIRLSSALAEELGCLDLHAEKKVTHKATDGGRDEEIIILKRYLGDIPRGARVLVGEELVNNISSAEQIVALIEEADAEFIGISCAINRSMEGLTEFMGRPIVSALHVPTPQYRQDDPIILDALRRGFEIFWEPKPRWQELKAAMDRAAEPYFTQDC